MVVQFTRKRLDAAASGGYYVVYGQIQITGRCTGSNYDTPMLLFLPLRSHSEIPT